MSLSKRSRAEKQTEALEPVAGNGLLHRRALLGRGIMLAGAAATGVGTSLTGAAAEPMVDGPWTNEVGAVIPPYQVASRFEKHVVRTVDNPDNVPRNSRARTPHHLVKGIITPNGLHFTICHGGVPDIDPDKHRLVIHGLVRRPLVFTLDALERYPMVSRIGFVECGGNSAPLFSNEPIQANVQALHGLASCSEWTGVLLSTLLEETGIDPKAKWIIAEGADSPRLHRSVPVLKALDDAMVALYQNGERIQPGQGYPMRLWLPGYQGNMNVKYLRRITLTEGPAMSYYEARTYTQVLPDGKAYMFHFLQEVKSFISSPSPGLTLREPGFYEITGVAYSGAGRISRVMVSADGPGLGKDISPSDLAPWDIHIMPDGTGLPPGSGTSAQGAPIYAQKCAACHGEAGKGGHSAALVGGPPRASLDGGKTIPNYWPYSTTLFDFIRRAMPYQAPKSLTDNEVYAVTAYILALNKLIGEGDVIDAQSLPKVQMPNRDNFIIRFPDRI